jgi:hypothetical protein
MNAKILQRTTGGKLEHQPARTQASARPELRWLLGIAIDRACLGQQSRDSALRRELFEIAQTLVEFLPLLGHLRRKHDA